MTVVLTSRSTAQAALVVQKSHGNPLVVQELVYALKQHELVTVDPVARRCLLSQARPPLCHRAPPGSAPTDGARGGSRGCVCRSCSSWI
jgi:hypothetical protein